MIAVKVHPCARTNKIIGLRGDELRIAIAAPPVDSAANDALVKFISKLLGVSRGRISIARGTSSQHKLLAVLGLELKFADRVFSKTLD